MPSIRIMLAHFNTRTPARLPSRCKLPPSNIDDRTVATNPSKAVLSSCPVEDIEIKNMYLDEEEYIFLR